MPKRMNFDATNIEKIYSLFKAGVSSIEAAKVLEHGTSTVGHYYKAFDMLQKNQPIDLSKSAINTKHFGEFANKHGLTPSYIGHRKTSCTEAKEDEASTESGADNKIESLLREVVESIAELAKVMSYIGKTNDYRMLMLSKGINNLSEAWGGKGEEVNG